MFPYHAFDALYRSVNFIKQTCKCNDWEITHKAYEEKQLYEVHNIMKKSTKTTADFCSLIISSN